MSADSKEDLEIRLEFILSEIQNIRMDMFNVDLSDTMKDYIRDIQEELNKFYFLF